MIDFNKPVELDNGSALPVTILTTEGGGDFPVIGRHTTSTGSVFTVCYSREGKAAASWRADLRNVKPKTETYYWRCDRTGFLDDDEGWDTEDSAKKFGHTCVGITYENGKPVSAEIV